MNWNKTFRAALGEFITLFALGIIAVPARLYANEFSENQNADAMPFWAYGIGFFAVTFAAGVVFRQYGGWHVAPHITVMSMLCDDRDGLSWPFVITHLIVTAFGLGGAFAAAGVIFGIFDFNTEATSLMSNVGFGTTFFFAFIGMLIWCHVWCFSITEHKGVWGVFGGGLIYGGLVGVFTPMLGGVFNLWLLLAFGAVQGNLDSTTVWACVLATFTAPIATAINRFLFFSRSTEKSNDERR